MSNKDEPGFYQGTRRYVVLLLSAAPIFAVSKFVQGKLGLDWRRWLTEHVCGLYFGNRAYYSLKNGLHKLPSSAGGSGDTKDERAEHDGDVAVGPTRGSRREEKQGGGIDNPISAVSAVLSIQPSWPRHYGNASAKIISAPDSGKFSRSGSVSPSDNEIKHHHRHHDVISF